MKIQDMRAGILHLSKRSEIERRDILELQPPPAEMFSAPKPQTEPAKLAEPETTAAPVSRCDLDEPRWSVVSFSETEAGGLTYRQAATLLNVLEANNVRGLCIVTDEAAKRSAG